MYFFFLWLCCRNRRHNCEGVSADCEELEGFAGAVLQGLLRGCKLHEQVRLRVVGELGDVLFNNAVDQLRDQLRRTVPTF